MREPYKERCRADTILSSNILQSLGVLALSCLSRSKSSAFNAFSRCKRFIRHRHRETTLGAPLQPRGKKRKKTRATRNSCVKTMSSRTNMSAQKKKKKVSSIIIRWIFFPALFIFAARTKKNSTHKLDGLMMLYFTSIWCLWLSI